MDFRFLMIAFVGAVCVYIVLDNRGSEDFAVADGELAPLFQVACAQEPEMCECIRPILLVVGQDEELMSTVMEVGFSMNQSGDAQVRAFEQMQSISPESRRRLFRALNRMDLGGMLTCMTERNAAFRQMVNSGELEAFQQLAEQLSRR